MEPAYGPSPCGHYWEVVRCVRYAVACFYCPAYGPLAITADLARVDATAAGWGHMPHVGGFERWQCPACARRSTERKSANDRSGADAEPNDR